MSLAEFRVRFPEFTQTPDALVSAKLTEAERSVSQEVWGETAYDGAYYRAAHLLAVSVFGQNARLVSNAGETTYNTEYKRLQREVAAGFRVL